MSRSHPNGCGAPAAEAAPGLDDLAVLRRDYALARLDEQSVDPDPIVQSRRWIEDALRAGALDPNAMTLATIGESGRPSARVVLLKGLDERGFSFFTSYESRKGRELAASPAAALVFFWPELERQIRVEGDVARTSAGDSDQYFAGRPLESQLAAWASAQSRTIASRAALENALAEAARRHATPVSRPPTWGGFRLVPISVELWQGRSSRLHDRILYRRAGSGWRTERLAP